MQSNIKCMSCGATQITVISSYYLETDMWIKERNYNVFERLFVKGLISSYNNRIELKGLTSLKFYL